MIDCKSKRKNSNLHSTKYYRKWVIGIRLSKYLNREQIQTGLDFLDVDTNEDVMLFVDPLLLPDNFKKIVYCEENKKDSFNLFSHSKECNATHLGYSSNNSKGKGVSMKMLDQFFSYVKSSILAVQEKALTSVAMPLFIKRFSEDRMSDLIVSLLKKELVVFSLEQARLHGFQISSDTKTFEYWDHKNHEWTKFESPYVLDPEKNKKDRLLILVPKTIVSKRYIISPAKYVSNIFSRLQLLPMYQDAKGKPYPKKTLRELKINKQYNEDKQKNYILDSTTSSPEYFIDYMEHSEKYRDNKSMLDDELISFL